MVGHTHSAECYLLKNRLEIHQVYGGHG